MSAIEEIEKQFPLTMSHETDCRDVWPKRWKAVRELLGLIGEAAKGSANGLRRYTVTVNCMAMTDDLHPIDKEENPVGIRRYSVEAPDGDREVAIEQALNLFYSRVPIKVLDDFRITTLVSTG